MKSSALTKKHFLDWSYYKQFNHLKLCIGSYLSWRRFWPEGSLVLRKAEQTKNSVKRTWNYLSSGKLSNSLVRLRVRAVQVAAVKRVFPRFCVGLVLLVWVAPYADVFYTRLDFYDRVPASVWYYESYHWLFLCLGPYLKGIISTIAYYLIFTKGGSKIFLAVAAYGLMYDVAKVLWLLQVANHKEYKALPTDWFTAYGFLTGAFLIFMLDKLTYWLNHKVLAIRARLSGLHTIAYKVDAETFRTRVVQTFDADQNVQQFKI